MSSPQLRPAGAIGGVHPAVLDRRIRDLVLIGLTGLIPAVIALGIVVEIPDASFATVVLVLGAIAGVLGVVALMASTRYEVTVTLLALYLGLLDGPVKLGLPGGELTHAVRNILILAVCVGAVMRLVVRREPVRLPALSGWVLAFVAVVALEAFNPKTAGILKVVGGFRQQLQWVPFFFFAFVLMRSKRRFRQFFLIMGVCALANGVLATYQTGLSPAQLASWGPGYRVLFQPVSVGKKAGHARVYGSEGEARVRPVGLGSDSGFSGGVGLLALPFSLALLATWRSRRRWVAAVLALGAIAGILTGLGRLQVVGGVLGVIAFFLLAAVGGRRVKRPLGALLAVVALAVPIGAVFVSIVGSGTFSRYNTFETNSASSIVTHKSAAYTKIPGMLLRDPFGVGLGTVGAVGGFGGANAEPLNVSSESQYNFIADELGAPGLALWIMLSVYVVVVIARGLRRVRDGELAILLAGACAPFVALIFMGFSGPLTTSAVLGPYFWFAIGIVAYWFAGPGRDARSTIAAEP
jgi:hypothetical protein